MTSLLTASSLFRASMLLEQPLTATFKCSHLYSLIAQLVLLELFHPHPTHTGRRTSPTCLHHPCHVLQSHSLFFSFPLPLFLILAKHTTHVGSLLLLMLCEQVTQHTSLHFTSPPGRVQLQERLLLRSPHVVVSR